MADLPKVFGNKTRVQIMACLADGKKDVTELINTCCGLSQSAVSQHLQILADSGVVKKDRKGRSVLCSLMKSEYGDLAQTMLQLDKEI